MLEDVIVLLLAGGNADRMWPLTNKHAIPFLGKHLFSYQLEQLSRWKVGNVVCVIEKGKKDFYTGLISHHPDMNIRLVEQDDTRGIAGAIISAKKDIEGRKLLVINPSDIYEDALFDQMQRKIEENPQVVLAGTVVSDYFPGGYLVIAGELVADIVEKPDPAKTPSNLVTLVFDYFINADILLAAIEKVKTTRDDVFEKAIQYLIHSGVPVQYLSYSGYWGTLKYPWHALSVSEYFLSRMTPSVGKGVSIDKTAKISGNVRIEDGVKILEYAKITGPAYIGRGVVIGNHTIVRDAAIGADSVVGFNTEIARSYVGEGCWFHKNYIGDSVIGDGVSFGSGATAANFRLDGGIIASAVHGTPVPTGKTKLGAIVGSQSAIGVNVSIMPGMKIGSNTFVSAGIVVSADVPDNKYCSFVSKTYSVRPNKKTVSRQARTENKNKLKF